jgi:hypothetical protein
MAISTFLSRAKRANDIRELVVIFDSQLKRPAAEFGVNKTFRVSIDRTRREANRKAIAALAEIDDPLLATDEQKERLRGYTGEGNIGGSTDEYYTPTWLAGGMWDALAAYGGATGNVLEPSAGTGVFNGTKPAGVIMTATELSPISSRINQILHPEDDVLNSSFETLAADSSTDNTFDSIVGNVPFGEARGDFINDDPTYKHRKTKQTYFVDRAIDKVKPGGYLTLVVPQDIVGAESLSKFRAEISLKAEFLGAHKIAAGAFSKQGSDSVVTDVLIMRKHSEELAELIQSATSKTLTEAKVKWAQFIKGQWFDKDGKQFVNGEIKEGAANYGRDLVVVPGLPKGEDGKQLTQAQNQAKSEMIDSHNEQTAKSLSKKFESRIDYALLALSEPENISYMEGDTRLINGRWHEYIDSAWLPVAISGTNGMLDSLKFGSNSIGGIDDLVRNPASALALPFDQLKNINQNFGDKTAGIIGNAFKLAAKQAEGHKERIVKGTLIGSMIENYSNLRERDPAAAATMLVEIQSHLSAMFISLGTSVKVKGLSRVKGDITAGYYQSFVNAMDEKGNFSDLMSGKLDTTSTIDFDTTNPQHTVDMLATQSLGAISVEDFKSTFTGTFPDYVNSEDDNSVLDYLCSLENVAVDNDGLILPLDKATSGKIVIRKAMLMRGLANDSMTEKQKINITRQLEEIERKRTRTPIDDVYFDLRGKWIPRQMVAEFFNEAGYDDLDYVNINVNDDGEISESGGYEGMDGLFTGYYTKNGKKVPDKDENRLIRQVEKYLNGQTVRGGKNEGSSEYREQIRRLEREFQNWIKQHPDVKKVVEGYDDAFNSVVQFEHDDSPLNLEGVSGNIVNMKYQNSAIRRLSEDGRGILGFGTGLGKTFTALGLVAHNTKSGRSKRTCVVIPKSVNENWINETIDFYGYGNIDKTVFVGFDFERDDKGEIRKTQLMEDGGVIPKKYPATGQNKTKPVLRERSSAEIATLMNKIPHSNTNLVIMTKEQFARIPMKAETIKKNADDHMGNLAATGKIEVFADSYKKQQAKEAALAKLVQEGSDKEYDYPFFEDMHFDTVIVDEGHNYRNSQEAGNLSRQLVFLSAGNEAKVAADMRQKMQYLGRKHNGRGAVLLTATPTPNSPLDIYNMLSHIVTPEEWLKMGIANQDDFINVFGETQEVQISRIDGSQAMAQGLTGFKNLIALRSLFDTHCNRKNIKDVASDTTVPEIINFNTVVEMNTEQKETYDMLRLRAEVLKASSTEGGVASLINMSGKTPSEQALIEEIVSAYPDDQIFSIMRDMERVSADMELFKKRMTFIFNKDKAEQAKAVIAEIKTPINIMVDQRNEHGEMVSQKVSLDLNPEVIADNDGKYIVSISDGFETALIDGLKKQKLTPQDVTHPVSPKYANLLENLKKSFLAGGKQIIFSEEKSQHKKLHRLICHHLGLEEKQVGILNGSTVSGDESAINEANYKKLGKKAKDAKVEELAALGLDTADMESEGLESIATRYNEGQFRILICNKKAEVGVNLHIQTTDIHHFSLPWHPAAIDQRNGRGARVGAPQTHVNSHFYLAKGSFDQFRLDTINRKRAWQDDLINGNESRADNGDADSDADAGLLMANNPEEYAAMLAMRKSEHDEKILQGKIESAKYTLTQYMVAARMATEDTDKIERNEANATDMLPILQREIDDGTAILARVENEYQEKVDAGFEKNGPYGRNLNNYERNVTKAKNKLLTAERNYKKQLSAIKKIQNKIKEVDKAKTQVKRLKPQVLEAIDAGLLNTDKEIVNSPNDYIVNGDKFVKVGNTHFMNSDEGRRIVVQIKEVDSKAKTVRFLPISGYADNNKSITVAKILEEVIISKSEVDLIKELRSNSYDNKKCYDALDNDTFFDLLGRGVLPSGMDVMVIKNDKYIMTELNYVKDKSTVLFMDKNSEALKEKIAHAVLVNRSEAGHQPSLIEIARLIFGDDFLDAVAKYDPDAETDEDIAQFVKDLKPDFMNAFNSSLETALNNERIFLGTSQLTNAIRGFMKKIPANTLRKVAFTTAINNRGEIALNLLSEGLRNKLQIMRDSNVSLAKVAAADTSEKVRTRLKSLPADIWEHDFYNDSNARGFVETYLTSEPYNGELITLVVDLIGIGYELMNPITSYDFTYIETANKAQLLIRLIKRDSDTLNQFIEGKVNETKPIEVIEAPEAPKEVESSDIPYAGILSEKFNITCRRNTTTIEFKSKKGKVYASGEPYDYIALSDPDGQGGPLNTALSPLKRKKKANWAVDTSNEFSGFWWFIKKDISEQEILDAFNL